MDFISKVKYLFLALACFFIFIPFSYCRVTVCTTTSIIAEMAEEIGGEHVQILSLMGPGVDPHLYKATASDVKSLLKADIILYNGLHLEGRMTDTFVSLKEKGHAIYPIADAIPKALLINFGESNEEIDPHIWFDPRLWMQCAQTVVEALSKEDPKNATAYKDAGAQYIRKLEALYKWGKQYSSSLPKSKRVLITSHDAYNYFGKAFDFTVIGVQGISTASEAGLADIQSTIDYIKKHKIKAIFVETSVSPAAISRISKDSGACIGGELFSDSLGSKNDVRKGHDKETFDVGTYEGMFKYNLYTIVEALR